MIRIESNGITFTADNGVPADFIVEMINCFEKEESIDEIKKEINEKHLSEYNLTYAWNDHINLLKEMVDNILDSESVGSINAINKYWEEKVSKRIKIKK